MDKSRTAAEMYLWGVFIVTFTYYSRLTDTANVVERNVFHVVIKKVAVSCEKDLHAILTQNLIFPHGINTFMAGLYVWLRL